MKDKWIEEMDKNISELYETINGFQSKKTSGGDSLALSIGMVKGLELARQIYEENRF